MQPLQHPQQDAGTLLGQLFDEEGIIHPGRVTVFHRDQDLSAPEAVSVIVSSHKVAIAEADETNIQQTLDSLLVLPFDAQTVFSGDDGLDVPCFGQSHYVQIVIDHDQLGQVRVCEAMKAPVWLLSDRTVLRQQDGGVLPRQVPHLQSGSFQCGGWTTLLIA